MNALALPLLAGLIAAPASPQVPTVMLLEGSPVPGAPDRTVNAFSVMASNSVGGFAVAMSTLEGSWLIWGSPADGPGGVLRTPRTLEGLEQFSIFGSCGLTDSGSVAYSARLIDGVTDGVWIDDSLVALEGDVPAEPRGYFLGSLRSVGLTADAVPYWRADLVDTPGSFFRDGSGFFMGSGLAPLVALNDVVPGVSFPVTDVHWSAVSRDGSVFAVAVSSDTGEEALVVNGLGQLETGDALPAEQGGLPGETVSTIRSVDVNGEGTWVAIVQTDQSVVALRNGDVLHRLGDPVDGRELTDIRTLLVNEAGDLVLRAFVRGARATDVAVFLNGLLVVRTGDVVDVDGDLAPDPGHSLVDVSAVTFTDRSATGTVTLYVNGEICSGGTCGSPAGRSGRATLRSLLRSTVELPECYLVIGTGPGGLGETSFDPGGGHTFLPQVQDVRTFQPVLLDDLGEIPLPLSPTASSNGMATKQDLGEPMLVTTFTAQVLMHDPLVFPTAPDQYTRPLFVGVFSDGSLRARPYGTGTGMVLSVECVAGETGPVIRFPFTIPGF